MQGSTAFSPSKAAVPDSSPTDQAQGSREQESQVQEDLAQEDLAQESLAQESLAQKDSLQERPPQALRLEIKRLQKETRILKKKLTRSESERLRLEENNYRKEQLLKQFIAELEQANQRLDGLAYLDGLTQLANRRRFDDYLQEQWNQAQSVAMILVDVDYFKRYNDHYGHQAGDTCLKTIAAMLRGVATRSEDLVARYGGEEFAFVLPNTSLEGCYYLAELVLGASGALGLPHAASDVADIVTLSLGIAEQTPQLGVAPAALVEMADRSLYAAKTAGRNRIGPLLCESGETCLPESGSSIDESH